MTKAIRVDAEIGDEPIKVTDTGYEFQGRQIFLRNCYCPASNCSSDPYIMKRFKEWVERVFTLLDEKQGNDPLGCQPEFTLEEAP